MARAAPPAPLALGPVIVTYAVAQLGAALLTVAAAGLLSHGSGRAAGVLDIQLTYVLSPLVLLATCGAAVLLARVPARRLPRAAWPGPAWAGLAVAAGVALKLGGDAAAAAEQHWLGPLRGNNPVVLYPHAFAHALPLAGLIVGVVAVVPVAEEVFFRGLLYGWLRGRLGRVPATAIGALLFAGAHRSLGLLAPLALVGAGLCWLYEESGSLWPPVLAHAAVNGAALALALVG